MRAAAHRLGPALALAALLVGLAAGAGVCMMADCPAMVADEQGCCSPGAASFVAACCKQSFEAPATPPRLPEAQAAGGPAIVAVLPAQVPVPAFRFVAEAACAAQPLDALSQSCILRI